MKLITIIAVMLIETLIFLYDFLTLKIFKIKRIKKEDDMSKCTAFKTEINNCNTEEELDNLKMPLYTDTIYESISRMDIRIRRENIKIINN